MSGAASYALVATQAGTYYGVTCAIGQVAAVMGWGGAANFAAPAGTELVPVPMGQTAAVGYLYDNGTFTAPATPAPSPSAALAAELAYAGLLANGISIVSTSTPALNGVYAIDMSSQAKITGVATYIKDNNNTFPNGSTANLTWLQLNGNPVAFPSPESFLAFADAVAVLVYAADIAVASATAMPDPVAQIP